MPTARTTRRQALTTFASVAGLIGSRSTPASATSAPRATETGEATHPAMSASRRGLTRTPFDFGAVGNAEVDDGPALRRALSSYGPSGGAIELPGAQYKAGASDGQVLLVAAPLGLSGKGAPLSIINPALACDSDDTLVISPNVNFSHEGLVVRDFGLLDPTDGTRRGKRGVFLNTNIPRTATARCVAGEPIDRRGTGTSAWGVHHQNGQASPSNVNGGCMVAESVAA